MEGGRERGREGEREGGREFEAWRDGWTEGGPEEGGRKEGREGGKEGGWGRAAGRRRRGAGTQGGSVEPAWCGSVAGVMRGQGGAGRSGKEGAKEHDRNL